MNVWLLQWWHPFETVYWLVFIVRCSVDPYLFENFETSDGDFLKAKFRAFKFPQSPFVLFKVISSQYRSGSSECVLECETSQWSSPGFSERVPGLLPGCPVLQRAARLWPKKEEGGWRGCGSKQGPFPFLLIISLVAIFLLFGNFHEIVESSISPRFTRSACQRWSRWSATIAARGSSWRRRRSVTSEKRLGKYFQCMCKKYNQESKKKKKEKPNENWIVVSGWIPTQRGSRSLCSLQWVWLGQVRLLFLKSKMILKLKYCRFVNYESSKSSTHLPLLPLILAITGVLAMLRWNLLSWWKTGC